jgi:hypothetical protein
VAGFSSRKNRVTTNDFGSGKGMLTSKPRLYIIFILIDGTARYRTRSKHRRKSMSALGRLMRLSNVSSRFLDLNASDADTSIAYCIGLPVKTEGPIRRAVLPTPVGVRGCGPARLSDLSVSKKQAAELAQCQAYEKENEIVLLDHDEASRGSKFFPPSKNRRQPGTPSSTGDIIITFENQSSLGDDLTEPSLKKEVPDTDDLPAMTSPSAACSTFMSPVKSSQHGSHFSSPGRDSDVSQGDEFDSQTFGSPVRTSTKQVEPNIRKRSAFSPAPVAKKRRLTTSPPRAELLLAINSSPEKPDAADNRIDLRKICHIDGSSSIHEDWEDEVENERPKIEPRDIETPESIKAKMVAKGLRAKYAFTPKVSINQSFGYLTPLTHARRDRLLHISVGNPQWRVILQHLYLHAQCSEMFAPAQVP